MQELKLLVVDVVLSMRKKEKERRKDREQCAAQAHIGDSEE